jgi:hypothetical protein
VQKILKICHFCKNWHFCKKILKNCSFCKKLCFGRISVIYCKNT